MASVSPELVMVDVWDVPTRVFHWINAVAVLVLAAVGLTILNGTTLGLSNEGKVLLKTLHVWVGYVFLFNLAWRIVWAFIGNRHARWRAMLPGGRGYLTSLRHYVSSFLTGRPESYQGHNPLGRIAVTVLLLALLVQGITGLVLAGTDIYYPPFGRMFAEWVAAPGVAPGQVVPYRPTLVDETAYAAMREFRAPFIEIHEIGFFVLLGLIGAHILAVTVAELREGGTLVSAMVTGRKVFNCAPVDAEATDNSEQAPAPVTGSDQTDW